MRWVYATVGTPMWEFTENGGEQAVMFYDAWECGLPPMTDKDWDALGRHLRIRRYCA